MELRLADMAALSTAKSIMVYPTLGWYLAIRICTDPKKWSDTENKIMRKARAEILKRVGLVLLVIACCTQDLSL